MTEKALALLLAECLEQHEYCTHGQMDRAAAELRRLHEVEQQRDELLEALKTMLDRAHPAHVGDDFFRKKLIDAREVARAAIFKATGE